MALSFANVFMALIEMKLIQQSETKHREWKCYVDDVLFSLSLADRDFFWFAQFASCHRPDVKYGIKKGEEITWPGTNSSKETFEEDLLKFKQRLKARRYPENTMEWSLSGVRFTPRQSFLAQTQKLKRSPTFIVEEDRGAGESRRRENRGREAGAEIKKAIVFCLLLGII